MTPICDGGIYARGYELEQKKTQIYTNSRKFTEILAHLFGSP